MNLKLFLQSLHWLSQSRCLLIFFSFYLVHQDNTWCFMNDRETILNDHVSGFSLNNALLQ